MNNKGEFRRRINNTEFLQLNSLAIVNLPFNPLLKTCLCTVA